MKVDRATFNRFMRNIRVNDEGCWMWQGQTDRAGYGRWTPAPGQPRVNVHRWSWEAHNGPIPNPDLQVDHTCHTRAVAAGTCPGGIDCPHRLCCNPAHLELVTASENTIRQNHAERRKWACPKGHPYDDANTIRRNGRRWCRACDNERKRQARARAREGTDTSGTGGPGSPAPSHTHD